nr:PP2C family serine/threonine-protein phosphatase [Sphingomonas lenta]
MTPAAHSWRWAGARAVGTSHLASGTPCQDAVAAREVVGPTGPVLVAAVADGAGSARWAGEGARATARGFVRAAAEHIAAAGDLPSEERCREWVERIRGEIAELAEAKGDKPREFAATLVAALVAADAAVIAHVGDGAAVVDQGDGWEAASWPAGGEYAGTTYFVTDRPRPRLVVNRLDRPIAALALFSDGIEALVLDETARRPHPRFFDEMFAVMRAGEAAGCDRDLSRSLGRYLRRDALNALTHDDKSLVLAVRR